MGGKVDISRYVLRGQRWEPSHTRLRKQKHNIPTCMTVAYSHVCSDTTSAYKLSHRPKQQVIPRGTWTVQRARQFPTNIMWSECTRPHLVLFPDPIPLTSRWSGNETMDIFGAQQSWCAQKRNCLVCIAADGRYAAPCTWIIAMESSEKWCNLQENCDLPISDGLLNEPAIVSSNPGFDSLSYWVVTPLIWSTAHATILSV